MSAPLDALRRNVSGRVAAGTAIPIVEIPVETCDDHDRPLPCLECQ